MELFTKKQKELCENTNICYICKEDKYLKNKKYLKVRDYYQFAEKHRGAARSICNLKDTVPQKIRIQFHNGSNYDYHSIVKELVEQFKKTTYLFMRKY